MALHPLPPSVFIPNESSFDCPVDLSNPSMATSPLPASSNSERRNTRSTIAFRAKSNEKDTVDLTPTSVPPVGPAGAWSKEEVSHWFLWCAKQYALNDLTIDNFSINGKALCILTKQDFCERAPGIGDVLYNTLQRFTQPPAPLDQWKAYNCQQAGTSGIPTCRVTSGYGAPLPQEGAVGALPHLTIPTNCIFHPALSMPSVSVTSSSPFLTPSNSPSDEAQAPGVILQGANSHENLIPLVSHQGTPASRVRSLIPHHPKLIYNPTSTQPNLLTLTHPTLPFHPPSLHKLLTFPPGHPIPPNDPQHHLPTQPHPLQDMMKSTNSHDNVQGPYSVHPTGAQGPPDSTLNNSRQHQMLSPTKSTSDCRLLWEFLYDLLSDELNEDCIRWEDQEKMTFRILCPNQLAHMWGVQKNKGNMTYEKLSRALRYYYKMDIIAKVPGRRLTYRFLTHPHHIKKGIRGARPGVPHHKRPDKDRIKAYIKNGVPHSERLGSEKNLSRETSEQVNRDHNQDATKDTRGLHEETESRIPLLRLLTSSSYSSSSPTDESHSDSDSVPNSTSGTKDSERQDRTSLANPLAVHSPHAFQTVAKYTHNGTSNSDVFRTDLKFHKPFLNPSSSASPALTTYLTHSVVSAPSTERRAFERPGFWTRSESMTSPKMHCDQNEPTATVLSLNEALDLTKNSTP